MLGRCVTWVLRQEAVQFVYSRADRIEVAELRTTVEECEP